MMGWDGEIKGEGCKGLVTEGSGVAGVEVEGCEVRDV